MRWDDFMDRYSDWSESTLRSRIASLEDIGEGEEVVCVVWELSDEKLRVQLLRKAMKLGVKFTNEDLSSLLNDVFDELLDYSGVKRGALDFDENDFDWDDFYYACGDLSEDVAHRCIPRIRKFGDSDEVVDAVLNLSPPLDEELYDRAVACGVRFSEEQKDLMGMNLFLVDGIREIGNLTDEDLNAFAEKIKKVSQQVDRDMARIYAQQGKTYNGTQASRIYTPPRDTERTSRKPCEGVGQKPPTPVKPKSGNRRTAEDFWHSLLGDRLFERVFPKKKN